MGNNVFCVSLAGEELGRMQSWGTSPESKARHLRASPGEMNDLPQTFMEPIHFKTACSRSAQSRMSTEYVSHVQDADGVTTTCRDRLTGKEFTVRSKYPVGADGGNSLVAEHAGLPFEGRMGVGGSMNILFRADLSRYVAHRPSVPDWVMQPGADVGGIGMGLVRMVRPWNEWLIVWGYDITQPATVVDAAMATQVARQLVGVPDLEIDLISANTWTVNKCCATHMQKDRVFIMADAAHRHPPLRSRARRRPSFWTATASNAPRWRNRLSPAPTSRSPNSARSSRRWAWAAGWTTRRSSTAWPPAATRPKRARNSARRCARRSTSRSANSTATGWR